MTIRLFVPGPLNLLQKIHLDQPSYHYLIHVMRRKHDDTAYVFNAEYGEWEARIALCKPKAFLIIKQPVQKPAVCGKKTHAILSLIKLKNLEWVVEKATEIGITAIHLVISSRCQQRQVNLERLRLIAKEATEQCGRLDIPSIFPPVALSHWITSQLTHPSFQELFMADEAIKEPLLAAQSFSADLERGFIIGPEGGFSEEDKNALFALKPILVPVSLGKNILRAETAAIVCAAWIHQASGPMRLAKEESASSVSPKV